MSYKEEVAEAVACEVWQAFRKGLRGRSTVDKLTELLQYLKYSEFTCCSISRRQVQVYNYLGALARAGLIAPGASIYTLQGGRIEIRR